MNIRNIIFFSSLFIINGCTLFCEDLNDELKSKIDNAQLKYKDVLNIENIPCEGTYINIKMKVSIKSDTIFFNELHKLLYDEEKKVGWGVLVIFDRQNNYMFSHSHNNKIYSQTGD
jgi:hypothetical protein